MLSRIYCTESEIRTRQINTLKVFNHNVAEIKEGSEYQLLFNSGGHSLTLIVSLSQDFPKEKPVLKVTPQIIHPWVSPEGEIVSAPGLLNFSVHSDLGRVVQAIIREFERTPPPLASDQPGSNITSPTVPARESDAMGRISPSYQLNYVNRQNFSPPTHTANALPSVAIPELNALSLEELQFLNECEEGREEFLESLPRVCDMNRHVDDLISSVEELSDSNLSKEGTLSELRKDIDVRIEEVTRFAFENERLNTQFQTLADKYSPRNIKEQLKIAAEQSSVESEKIADTFLQGEMDVDKFVTMYLQTRTLGQARKTKEEKLSQQLHHLERAGF